MKLLNRYKNGNITVTLFDNGTKIQEWDDNEQPNPNYPNSMDIKITNYCDAGCQWCHEMSTIEGKHADLNYLLKVLENLPKGTELALGGGNPLDHPDLEEFLIICKNLGLIPNLTVNYIHLCEDKYISFLNKLIDENLIYGGGVSIPTNFKNEIIDKINNKQNVVYHIIAGVHHISVLDKIKNSPVQKVLILGYKNYGRGSKFLENTQEIIETVLKNWNDELGNYLGKIQTSFDNLALKQLNVQKLVPENVWKNSYMGDDGQFTMYIDAVEQSYAKSSVSVRYPIFGNIKELFQSVKDNR